MGISRKWVGDLPNVLTTNGCIANMAAKKHWQFYIEYASATGIIRYDVIDAWWDKCEIVLADKGLPARNRMMPR